MTRQSASFVDTMPRHNPTPSCLCSTVVERRSLAGELSLSCQWNHEVIVKMTLVWLIAGGERAVK